MSEERERQLRIVSILVSLIAGAYIVLLIGGVI